MDTLSPQEREALQGLYRILGHFRAMMGPKVPSQVIMAYLAVALEEGQPLNEYASRLGSKTPTKHTQHMDLAERNRHKGDGHKLIERRDNPLNEREKLMTLSAQGKLMRRLVLETLGA